MSSVSHRATVRICQLVVAREYDLTLDGLLAKTRRPSVSRPRQIAMYLAVKLTKCSLPVIADRFGGMDHTTVMYARDRIGAMMAADEEFRHHVETLARRVEAGEIARRAAAADPASIEERLAALEQKVGQS